MQHAKFDTRNGDTYAHLGDDKQPTVGALNPEYFHLLNRILCSHSVVL